MRIDRRWLFVLGLSLGVSVSNSFARFAYGLLVPAMQQDLSWSYTQIGWINTANALGYVAGAFLTLALAGRVSSAKLYIAGLLVTSMSLLMCGFNSGFWYLSFWRIMAGIAGAPVFICGGAMVAMLFRDNQHKNALAIAGYFGGAGFGMIVSGGIIPAAFEINGAGYWDNIWIGLGFLSFLLSPISIWAALQINTPNNAEKSDEPLPIKKMKFALVSYGLFAAGYIVYFTFIVAWMNTVGVSYYLISICWALIGIGIILSPFLWKPVLARFSSGIPLALACAVTGISTLWPFVLQNSLGLLASALCFGLAVFIGPGSVTSFARKNLPQYQWAKSVSLFTLIFAVGQTIGPIVAGYIADISGTLTVGILGAGAILLVAAGIASFQKPLLKTH